jgi:nucleoside-diphosphate-sugar epimerase
VTRLLITGGTGFVGSACVRNAVARGHEVHVLSRTSPDDAIGATFHCADLLTQSAGRILRDVQPTHLLHLAWIATPGSYWTSAENVDWVRASAGLLDEFATVGGRRAVIAGTCAEYDWSDGGRLDETRTELRPGSVYGQAKVELFRRSSEIAIERDLLLAWARLFFLYGPGEHPDRLVPYVVRQLLAGEEALCSNGSQCRDFLYVDDAADALVSVLLDGLFGAVNVASGESLPVAELIDAVAGSVGRPDLIRLGARPAPAGDPPELVGDVTRLRDEVGWRPRFPIAKGVDATVAWWKEHDARTR